MTCELRTYSQEPAAESLPTSSLDTPQSSPLSGSPTPAKSCASDSPACESSKAMSDPWTSRASWLASMQSALAFLVRTSALLEKVQALEASEADSTARSCEQLTLFDPPGFSSKTAHSSEPEAGTSSLVTWWRADIPGAMDSLPRLMLAPRTSEIGGGALQGVPTPTVCGNYNRKGASPTSGDGLAARASMWPTPTKSDGCGGPGHSGRAGGLNLRTAAATWPTPVASDWRSGMTSEATASKNSRPLREQVIWRSPNTVDAKGGTRKPGLCHQAGGALNPEWVEWLMGWPIGHTELKHWATAKSRCKRRLHGLHLAARTTSEVSA